MELFNPVEEHPPPKARRYIIAVVSSAVVVFLFLWYPMGLRFHRERVTVRRFMNEVVAGDMQAAYRTWKPSPAYSFNDFLEDWGRNGDYGPVKSYKIETEEGVKNASTAAIVVTVSADQPFPAGNDESKQKRTREITLWVDPRDESISFPPCGQGPNPRPCA
jgi:hypothetical protein